MRIGIVVLAVNSARFLQGPGHESLCLPATPMLPPSNKKWSDRRGTGGPILALINAPSALVSSAPEDILAFSSPKLLGGPV